MNGVDDSPAYPYTYYPPLEHTDPTECKGTNAPISASGGVTGYETAPSANVPKGKAKELALPAPKDHLPKVKKVTLKLGDPPSKSLEGGIAREDLMKSAKSAGSMTNKHPPNHVAHDVIVEAQRPHDVRVETQKPDEPHDVIIETQKQDEPRRLNPKLTGPVLPDRATQMAEDILDSPPRLTDVITLGEPLIDVHKSIVNQYQNDSFFSKILKSPKAFKNFEPTLTFSPCDMGQPTMGPLYECMSVYMGGPGGVVYHIVMGRPIANIL
ncbi:hypothetical protein EV424DRAFT_1344474 [Suillus variegatus]|nr:hypothetical protein EV424DRAFT_1344474 [Suillus variegatus]